PGADARGIDWLYRCNPDGPALVWLAMNDEGRLVGISVAHPRRMRVYGTVVRALNLGDFALDLPYRSLGPGLQLLRATLEPVRRGEYAFSYDFASRPMQAIYQRLGGGTDIGGVEYRVRRAAPPWRLWRPLRAGVGDVAAPDGTRYRLEVERLAMAPGDEFDALDTRLALLRPVLGVRDAAYLNWRYVRHTMWRHDILCARRNGVLVGYAILRRGDGGRVTLMDLYAEPDKGIREGLAAMAEDWARAHGARGVTLEVLTRSATAQMANAVA